MDEGSDSWLIIPKSDFIDALAADAGKFWQPGDGHNLQAWARKTHTQIADRIYDMPSGLNHAILEGDYKSALESSAAEGPARHGDWRRAWPHWGGGMDLHDHGW